MPTKSNVIIIKVMSKFHKTFKNEFIIGEAYQGILSNEKITFKYESFERGHLHFISDSGVRYIVNGGSIRDGKWKLFKDEKLFTVNGWVKID